VWMPTTNNLAKFTENFLTIGQPATNAPGVLFYYTTNAAGFTNGATIFQIGSGIYKFSATNINL
jgi:hypothetical protein